MIRSKQFYLFKEKSYVNYKDHGYLRYLSLLSRLQILEPKMYHDIMIRFHLIRS